jgi:hypothetical protein
MSKFSPTLSIPKLGGTNITVKCERYSWIGSGHQSFPLHNGIATFMPPELELRAVCNTSEPSYCFYTISKDKENDAYVIFTEEESNIIDESFVEIGNPVLPFVKLQVVGYRDSIIVTKNWSGPIGVEFIPYKQDLTVIIQVEENATGFITLTPFICDIRITFSYQLFSDSLVSVDNNSQIISSSFLSKLGFSAQKFKSNDIILRSDGSIYGKRNLFNRENLSNIDYEFFDLPYSYHIKCISFNLFGKSNNQCENVCIKEGESSSSSLTSNLGLIIGLSLGGGVVLIGIVFVLIKLFILKKENDEFNSGEQI